jgi:hypothetical protein
MRLLRVVARELFGWFVLTLLWAREIIGWVILVLGLIVFYECFVLLVSTPPRIIQVIPLTFMGFILFRGGLAMLRTSTAGLICLRAQKQLDDGIEPVGRKGPARPQVRTVPFYMGPREKVG